MSQASKAEIREIRTQQARWRRLAAFAGWRLVGWNDCHSASFVDRSGHPVSIDNAGQLLDAVDKLVAERPA